MSMYPRIIYPFIFSVDIFMHILMVGLKVGNKTYIKQNHLGLV